MKRKIDVRRLKKEAKDKKVNFYLLVKRELNYRKINFKDLGTNCFNCKSSQYVTFNDGKKGAVCSWVGEFNDPYAFVDANYICCNYKKSFSKNLSLEEEKDNENI